MQVAEGSITAAEAVLDEAWTQLRCTTTLVESHELVALHGAMAEVADLLGHESATSPSQAPDPDSRAPSGTSTIHIVGDGGRLDGHPIRDGSSGVVDGEHIVQYQRGDVVSSLSFQTTGAKAVTLPPGTTPADVVGWAHDPTTLPRTGHIIDAALPGHAEVYLVDDGVVWHLRGLALEQAVPTHDAPPPWRGPVITTGAALILSGITSALVSRGVSLRASEDAAATWRGGPGWADARRRWLAGRDGYRVGLGLGAAGVGLVTVAITAPRRRK